MSWLLVGSIPGVLIGSGQRRAAGAGPAYGARRGARPQRPELLDVPYANEIVVVSLSVGLGALLVWGVVVLVRRRGRLQPAVAGVARPALHEVARPVRH